MMKYLTLPGRLTVISTLLVLSLAACGSGTVGGDPASLPTIDPAADQPDIGGTCLAGEPDCNDTGSDVAEPLNPLYGDDDTSSGALANGGLTVAEALATDATGILAVRGFLLDNGTGARLCDALAESYPPQCGLDSLGIEGHEGLINVPLSVANGVSWTDETVVFFGEIVDGVLRVSYTVSG